MREAVEGIGVVGGPDLVDVAQDAKIHAAAAAGAGLDFDFGMTAAQLGENGVEIAREFDVDALLLGGRQADPSRARSSCGCSPT